MNTFPELETKRLLLSKLTTTDIPNIIKYAGNIRVAETTLHIPHPYSEADAIFWINAANDGFKNKTQYTFGIRIKNSKEFIGGIGLKINARFNRALLGYWIAEPYWNKGYASESTSAILKFGFEELNIHKIYATHLVENPASGKVMINNKMIKEGELKDHTKKGDSYRSLIQYRLIREEYFNTLQE